MIQKIRGFESDEIFLELYKNKYYQVFHQSGGDKPIEFIGVEHNYYFCRDCFENPNIENIALCSTCEDTIEGVPSTVIMGDIFEGIQFLNSFKKISRLIDQIPDIEALKSALNDYEGVRLDLKFQHSNIKQFVGNFTYKKQVRKFEVLNAIRYLNKNEDTELKEWVMGQLANMKSNYDDIYVYIRQQLDYGMEIQNEYNTKISTVNRIRSSSLDTDIMSSIYEEIDQEILNLDEEIANEGHRNRELGIAWTTQELEALAKGNIISGKNEIS